MDFFPLWLQPSTIYIHIPTTVYPLSPSQSLSEPIITHHTSPFFLIGSSIQYYCPLDPTPIQTHVSYLLASFFPKTLKMGQTSDTETLVIHQKMMPGNNPEDFKQHYDHGGSFQLHRLPVSSFTIFQVVLILFWISKSVYYNRTFLFL
jgi:hypothetical protein